VDLPSPLTPIRSNARSAGNATRSRRSTAGISDRLPIRPLHGRLSGTGRRRHPGGNAAAGAIGNLRPIEIVTERWYSPELRVVVFSRRADPRFGETIYRLTNITRRARNPMLLCSRCRPITNVKT
jgi:hypothetical protein